LITALNFVSCGQIEDAAKEAAPYPAFEPKVTCQPNEEPETGLTIYDQRVETIEIDQSLYAGIEREIGDHGPLDYYSAGKETTLIVTFKELIDEVFSKGIPLCYISVYNEGELITQIAASGLYDSRNLYFRPKNISESGNWAAGLYTFELYLGDDEGAVAAVLTEGFREAIFTELSDNEDPLDNIPIEPPEIINEQTEVPEIISEQTEPPEIINEQTGISEVKMSEGIRYEVSIYDVRDGWLSGSEVSWSHDGKEYLAGSTLWVWPYELPPGTHTFTCTATNSEGISSHKDFVFNVTEDESDLPDDWSGEEIAGALSKGLVLPLNRLEVPVSRGQYANLMADFYGAFSESGETYPNDMADNFKISGRDSYNQSLMVHLGAMEAQDGYFEPNKWLSEEEAALIMCRIVALTIPDFFGAVDAEGIMEALNAYGVFDTYGPGSYKAAEKLTQKLALVRLSRLYDIVVANSLRIIAEGFKLYECDDAAIAIRAALIKSGKQGAIINLYFSAESNVFVGDRETGMSKVSTTGIHVGVLFNGRVHCNVFPGGLPEDEWLESFFEYSGRSPWIEYLPF